GLGLLVVGNVFQVLQLWWSGWIELRTVLIFSVLVLMWLGVIGLGLVADKPGRSAGSSQTGRARGGWLALPLCAAILVVGFPLGQAFSLGRTDYRRPVPVAVVLGAKAHPDGRPSDALRDRVMTAVELYHQGLVEKLVFSGGPTGRLDAQARAAGPEAYNLNPDEIDEPRAMRMLAVRHGVPEEAIVLDHHGWNTRLTARQVAVMMEQAGVGDFQVIAVSHDFHLPRIKMAFEQEGLGVLTVPARERYMLRRKPMLVAREVPAFWAYWLGLGR
ncbi:MAG: YdcF family protein, partial [Phycisphaeraceae bacterium]|nr:YdcF family protein [Phycisphaeraceae bacterium]